MRLTRMICDGCGKTPGFLEWFRGEIGSEGYPDWRHPNLAFRNAGCVLTYDNRAKGERMFMAMFGRPFPDEAGFLCPRCQQLVLEELPALWEADTGDDLRSTPREPWR